MVCKKCGTEIAEKAIVCYRCGTPTMETPAVLPQAPSRRSTLVPGLLIVIVAVTAAAVAGVHGGTEAIEVVLLAAGLILVAFGLRRRQ